MNSFVSFAGDTLKKQAEALWHMAEDLDGSFDEVIRCLLSISGRIAVSGMGKSGHVARKVAATLASTGSPAYFIHPSAGNEKLIHERIDALTADVARRQAEITRIRERETADGERYHPVRFAAWDPDYGCDEAGR